MPIVGYLEIPDVPGEAAQSDHAGQIEVHGIAWPIAQATAATGTGRRQARADVGPITVDKLYDASSPYLAHAAMTGRAFPEMTLAFDTAAEAHLDYLTIRLRNCAVSRYELLPPDPGDDRPRQRAGAARIRERLSLAFEHIRIVYTEQNRDGSAGAEHEVEYDVSAGA